MISLIISPPITTPLNKTKPSEIAHSRGLAAPSVPKPAKGAEGEGDLRTGGGPCQSRAGAAFRSSAAASQRWGAGS